MISFNNDINADNIIVFSLDENANFQHEIVNIIVVVHEIIIRRKNDSSMYIVNNPLIDNVGIVINIIGCSVML